MAGEIVRVPDGLIRQIQTIAAEECANCDEGNCLLLDDGEPCVCPQRISHSLWCRYFIAAVLPAHKDLYYKLCGKGVEKRCAVCGRPVYSHSNRAKYCDHCRTEVIRKYDRERKRPK